MFPWPHVITVIGHTAGPEDELGNASEVETKRYWRGYFAASAATSDFGSADEPNRFQTSIVVLFEPDAMLNPADDLEFEGRRYRVLGEPLRMSDLQGLTRHWEVTVVGYAAEELIGS